MEVEHGAAHAFRCAYLQAHAEYAACCRPPHCESAQQQGYGQEGGYSDKEFAPADGIALAVVGVEKPAVETAHGVEESFVVVAHAGDLAGVGVDEYLCVAQGFVFEYPCFVRSAYAERAELDADGELLSDGRIHGVDRHPMPVVFCCSIMFGIGQAQYLRFEYKYGAGEAYHHKRKPEQEPEPKVKFMIYAFEVFHRKRVVSLHFS